MFRKCSYDATKDLQPVDKVGWVDIAEAVKNGYVPASINAEDMVYNEIEDPASVMPQADDVFAMYRQADYIKGYKPSSSESDEQTDKG